MIEITELQIERGNQTICAVKKLSIRRGARVWIHGRNGSGKSTLLRVIAGIEKSAHKTCVISVPKNQVAYLDQKPYLFKGGLRHNLAYGLKTRGISGKARIQKVDQAIVDFDLAGLENQDLSTASGGERQRIALARALILEPSLLLLDEPFAELDGLQCQRMKEAIDQVQDLTLVISSPYPPDDDWVGETYELQRVDAALGATKK